MTSIGIKLTTISPLLLSATPPAHNLIETMDFIPGNSLRGMLAQRYLSQGGKPEDEDFRRLFLTGKIRFGFARINGAQRIPLSARSCKYHTGFKKNEGHGVMDLLLDGVGEKRCEKSGCGQSIDYIEGFWNPLEHSKEEVRKRLITRTAIDSVRGSAANAQLYSQRVIEEGQTFRATVEAPDDLADVLKKLLSSSFVAGIGTGRSRGQGWVEVKQDAPPDFPLLQSAPERFEHFRLKAGSAVLALTLLSDAIFQDDYLRDCTAPCASHLKPLDDHADQWECLPYRAFASQRMVFGFDGEPLRLPRVPRMAVTAGSTFLFKTKEAKEPSIPDGDGMGWIGEKNGEGFGQAVLWHPFHLNPEEEIHS